MVGVSCCGLEVGDARRRWSKGEQDEGFAWCPLRSFQHTPKRLAIRWYDRLAACNPPPGPGLAPLPTAAQRTFGRPAPHLR